MPQMSPMNWIILFMNFLLIFFLINANNYFFIKYEFKSKILSKKIKTINWKW
uniref:ATP synthase complex subunit 8 n=1 Tax=Cleroidea sp. 1 KM-2017 TaxID=2219306 RepID=A0A346RG24_9CUCU|nr:ATP synthase F0 subunit 8 [Cleroidea sp. 1 KM-2017]